MLEEEETPAHTPYYTWKMAQDADGLLKPHVPILMKLFPQGQGGHCKGDHSTRVKEADISKVLYKNLSCIIKEVFIHE